MMDDSIFMLTEIWVLPNSFSELKKYRTKSIEILAPFKPVYIFHNHAFDWVYGGENEQLPSGIEIIKFESEHVANSAVAALAIPELKQLEKEIFVRIRSYFSKYAFPEDLQHELFPN